MAFNFFCTALWLFIGLRYKTGADWDAYIERMNHLVGANFSSVVEDDIAYGILNWLSANIFGGIYFVNSICAAITIYFIYKIIIQLPNYWAGLAVLFQPFFVYVAMNQTRQGVAIAILSYLALMEFEKRINIKTLTLCLLAFFFHSSALIFLMFYFTTSIVSGSSGCLRMILIILLILSIVYSFFEKFNYIFEFYVRDAVLIENSLSFFLLRIIMSLAAAIFLLLRKDQLIFDGAAINRYSISSIPIIALLIIFSSGIVFIERIAAYWIPLQAIAFTNQDKSYGLRPLYAALFVGNTYFFVLVIWFLSSSVSEFWIPYDNLLLNL